MSRSIVKFTCRDGVEARVVVEGVAVLVEGDGATIDGKPTPLTSIHFGASEHVEVLGSIDEVQAKLGFNEGGG